MSDTEKDRPESPKDVEPEAKPSGGGAVVISIEQARAELLAKPRQRATPQMGVMRSRPRAREVPAPVTMPPGEHTAFIVTDTPAARAHVDKKTVHPGEMPVQTHDKKVRVKTSLDPRRAKTQMSDRRGAPESPGPAPGEGDPVSLWHPTSQPPPPAQPAASPASIPPRDVRQAVPRPSFARPKPLPREKAGVPLFVIGVIIAASVGAAVVYILGRTGAPGTASSTATVAATAPPAAPPASSPAATAQGGATTAAAAPSTSATATEAPSTVAAVPTAAPSAPSAVRSSAAVKPSTAPTLAPTATAKPTATSVLPFGVGHD